MDGVVIGLVLGFVLAGVAAGVAAMALRGRGGGQAAAAPVVLQAVEALRQEMGQVRTDLAVSGERHGQVTDHVARTLQELEQLKARVAGKERDERRMQESLDRLQAVFTGSFSKGKAGEAVVEQALRSLPPEMVQRDVAFGTKRVEFALVMPNGRLLVLDSKVVASSDLLALEDEDEGVRTAAGKAVADSVKRKASELTRYRDPERTTDFAIAAIPDAAWTYCGRIQVDAWQDRVVLVPYSMLLPYVLATYQLHRRYAREVDTERLLHHLGSLSDQLRAIDEVVQNKVAKAATMTANAQKDLGDALFKAQASLDKARGLAEDGRDALPEDEVAALAGGPRPLTLDLDSADGPGLLRAG